LLSALIELQVDEQAGIVAADILRIEPGFSRKHWVLPLGANNPAVATRLSENLRKAGLPE
jgi:hypothetical protein